MIRRALIAGLLRGLSRLPLPVVHALGTALGWLLWLIPNQPRRIAAINLALCFPHQDAAARRRLLRHNLVQTAKGMLELGPLWFWDQNRILALVRGAEGVELLDAALERNRGVIVITPHLGSWEMAGLYYSARYGPRYRPTLLYRPGRLGLDALIRSARGRLGAQLVATDTAGIRVLLQTLRANGWLGILPDQDPGRGNGIFVPFFGLAANTITLVSRLAIKTGAATFLTYAERLPRSRGYRVYLEPLPEAVGQEPLEASVAAMNAALEQTVRRLPEQYLWAYKRFKTRPPGQPRLYDSGRQKIKHL